MSEEQYLPSSADLRKALSGSKGLDFWDVLVALRGPDLPSEIAVPLKLIFTARLRKFLFRDAVIPAVTRAEPKIKPEDLCDILVNLPKFRDIGDGAQHYLAHVARAFAALPALVDLSSEERSECFHLSLLAHVLESYIEGDRYLTAKRLNELPDWMIDINKVKTILKSINPELYDKLFSDLEEGESNGCRGEG